MESYPEGLYENISIKLRLEKDTGFYVVYCPEWKYETVSKNPGLAISVLLDEIIKHNAEELQNESV